MLIQEIIAKKRDRLRLSADEVQAFVDGVVDGSISDAQAAALSMAIVINGMDREETAALTLAMRDSGEILRWDLPGPVVDKHSTGGVGDKVSLVVAPVVAACGGYVPRLSGRGLGHTGGTLDKLEAIPGYTAHPPRAHFQRVVGEVGCAIVGADADMAPADKRLYAIRDVTATVESTALICASILSKKLAAGLDATVIDVKCGSGAFLSSVGAARELAASLDEVAAIAGTPCRTVLSDMNQCLGRMAGNALEVHEALAMLKGEATDLRFESVTVRIAGTMLELAELATDHEHAAGKVRDALASGAAAERFGRMVHGLGGPSDVLERAMAHLPQAPITRPARALRGGHVMAVDVRQLGWAIVDLGGGRRTAGAALDHAVGLSAVLGHGEIVREGEPLAVVHARNEDAFERAVRRVQAAMVIGDEAPPATDLFKSAEPDQPPRPTQPRPVDRRSGPRRRGR